MKPPEQIATSPAQRLAELRADCEGVYWHEADEYHSKSVIEFLHFAANNAAAIAQRERELEAEIAKLRAALQEVSEVGTCCGCNPMHHASDCVKYIGDIAREALKESEATDE
jgi:hypothetical protein